MRVIMHVDMDAFFASVEERYNPQFRGRPVVVGADPNGGRGRGVVSTANYPARRYGIKSAMPISQAWRLAEAARRRGEPETVFLQGNHALYTEVSGRIMSLLAGVADAFEEASIDEAYLQWNFEFRNSNFEIDPWRETEERARHIKRTILAREGLTCSVGIGPNKLVAKIASDFKKPDGLTVVGPEAVQQFLDPLPIRVMPGIGPKGEAFLHQKGIKIIKELRAVERSRLIEWFGKWGEDLYRKARGVSDSEVSNEGEPKSVGEQETFAEDTLAAGCILERARELGTAVFRRLQHDGFRSFRTVVVTVRFADFITRTRSRTVSIALTSEAALAGEVLRLLLPFLDARENPRRKKIRLIGVRVEKLER